MAKIFTDSTVSFGGGIKFGDGFKLAISSNSGNQDVSGIIAQNIDIQTSRPITPIYDLTSNKVYYVTGRPTVQTSIQRVCGTRGIIGAFYDKLGDVCNMAENNVNLQLPDNCTTGSSETVTGTTFNKIIVKLCVLTDVQFSCNTGNYVISEGCRITGAELEMA
jgi:hypothetical protein